MMNQGEAQAAALLLGLLGAYVMYKTGLYKLPLPDYLAAVVLMVAIPFFAILFLKARFS